MELRAALEEALQRFALREHAAAQARDEHARLSRARDALARGEPLSWSAWLDLEDSRVKKAALRHLEHPLLCSDLCALIDLVFDVSRRAMARYADDKREAGVVDFVDQEKLALRLVHDPVTRSLIQQSVQLLLVDEFQDTSPLQLSLFNALSDVVRRTIVVGDTKQTIFGFRDANPELFQRFLEKASNVDQLKVSYRSRPGLVNAVSSVFSAAFARDGHAPETVKLTAKEPVDVDDKLLGAHVERWWDEPQSNLPTDNDTRSEEDLASAGVAELLSTRDVPVRSHPQPGVRPAQAKDIAILCRTNAQCRLVAAALSDRGVPVLLRRRGLAKTLEARVIAAALSLWIDKRDALAAASLARMLGGVDETLLMDIVSAEKGQAFLDHPLVVAVVAAAEAERRAGVVAAFDCCVSVLRLRERVVEFGDAAQRLADLAALRALCVRFVDDRVARAQGPTVAGLLARLDELKNLREDEDDVDDERGDVAGKDAVSVLTWHKSKGREWPIVVLTGLWKSGWVNPFEVVVESDVILPSLQNPLFGRRLRVWPSPYGAGSKGALHKHLLTSSPQVQKLKQNSLKEDLRLLYVGFTRARDRVILVGDSAVWSKGMMASLVVEGRALCGDPPGNAGTARWGASAAGAGVDVDVEVRAPPVNPKHKVSSSERVLPPVPDVKPQRAPMFVAPSSASSASPGSAGQRWPLGGLISTTATVLEELNPLGQCVHAFLAVDAFEARDQDNSDERRHRLAARLRKSFVVEELMSTASLVEIGRRLWQFLDDKLPHHVRRTEVPMLHQLAAGTIVRGFIDLLVEHDGGLIVIDHKTTMETDVTQYAAQLQAYAAGVAAATNRPVTGTWIHLPLLGEVVEVGV